MKKRAFMHYRLMCEPVRVTASEVALTLHYPEGEGVTLVDPEG